jgi:ABC-type transporter Mla subunit MlaD
VSGGPGRPSASKQHGLAGRRPLAIAIVLGIVIGALFAIAAGGDDDGGYLVRAEFDNGSFVIPGEDVKIAGVKVGAIHDVDLTEDHKAAVVLKIDDPAFVPFREDAGCQIRLQSLIGEQFIECKPTRPRGEGQKLAPELTTIEDGRGEGQHLLPVENNTSPVPIDLIQNIQRLPQREGFRLLINEFGAGLAANGDRLRDAIRRANPALRETDRIVKVLADQDRLLGNLVDNSDQVLAAWAQKRKETAGFIDHAGATAVASAERGDDIERNFERLPTFLRELKPTADSFAGLADQMTPALNNLNSQATAINQTVQRLGPFTNAATPAVTSLGNFADRARELFPAIRPLVGDLRRLGRPARPATNHLAKLFGSVDDTGGIEELMKLIYFYTGSVNGVDELGHYVRSSLTITCAKRQPGNSNSCDSTLSLFGDAASKSAWASASNAPEMPKLEPISEQTVRRDAEAAGYDIDSKDAEPLLDYLLGSTEGAR